jgi:dihydroflavonol-4-reductase
MSTLAFVSGVTGFVGASLARLLLERGYEVRTIVRPGSDRGNLPVGPGFEAIEGDLKDRASVERAMRGCEEAYHVAADYRFWARDPGELYQNNVRGTANVLEAAGQAGVRRIVHTSTVGTIGLSAQPAPCDETTPSDPGQFASHYKLSKLEAERLALEYARKGLPVVIVNPSTPIGPWDRKPTPTGKIIVDFINGKLPAYVATGLDFADVRDVAEGHWLAAQKGRVGERYILGGQNLTMVEFLDLVARQAQELGIEGAPQQAPGLRIPYRLAWLTGVVSTAWADYVSHREPRVAIEAVKMSSRYMYFDSSKARRELGYAPGPLDAPVRDALRWFQSHGYFKSTRSSKLTQKSERKAHVHPV